MSQLSLLACSTEDMLYMTSVYKAVVFPVKSIIG